MIEKLLTRLFDYQRFERNKKLERIITEIIEKYEPSNCYISEGDLLLVAGGKDTPENYKKPLEEKEN